MTSKIFAFIVISLLLIFCSSSIALAHSGHDHESSETKESSATEINDKSEVSDEEVQEILEIASDEESEPTSSSSNNYFLPVAVGLGLIGGISFLMSKSRRKED